MGLGRRVFGARCGLLAVAALACAGMSAGAQDVASYAECAEYLTAPGATSFVAHFSSFSSHAASTVVPNGPTNFFTPSSIQDHPITTFYPGLQRDVVKVVAPAGAAVTWTVNGHPAKLTPVLAASSTVVATKTCAAAFVPSTALSFSNAGTFTHQFLGQVDAGPAAAPNTTFAVSALVGGAGMAVSNLVYVPNDAANPTGSMNPNSIYGDVTVSYAPQVPTVVRLQLTANGTPVVKGLVSMGYVGPTQVPDATATSVTVGPRFLVPGGQSSVTAVVTDTVASNNTPVGGVVFSQTVGGVTTVLGTVALVNGQASAAYTFGTPGLYTVTGTYVPSVGTNFLGSMGTAGQTVNVAAQTVWVLNWDGTLVALDGTKLPLGASGALSPFGGVAVDAAGSLWSVTADGDGLKRSTYVTRRSVVQFFGGGLIGSSAVAVDGGGRVWVANMTGSSVSLFTNAGVAVSEPNGIGFGSFPFASSIAVDQSGSVWVANASGNTVTEIVGAASPVMAPTSAALANQAVGVKP